MVVNLKEVSGNLSCKIGTSEGEWYQQRRLVFRPGY